MKPSFYGVSENITAKALGLTQATRRQGYQLSSIHQYTEPDGEPSWWVLRLESTSTPRQPKRILPMRRSESGFELKRPEFGAAGATLYNRHLLANYPEEVVYLVEGEKSADCLTRLGLIATTWPNGALALAHADLSPLARRRVVCWPDNDVPGQKAMLDAQARLHQLGAFALLLDVDALDLPPKGDAVDWLEKFVRGRSAVELCDVPGGLDDALSVVQTLPVQLIREAA